MCRHNRLGNFKVSSCEHNFLKPRLLHQPPSYLPSNHRKTQAKISPYVTDRLPNRHDLLPWIYEWLSEGSSTRNRERASGSQRRSKKSIVGPTAQCYPLGPPPHRVSIPYNHRSVYSPSYTVFPLRSCSSVSCYSLFIHLSHRVFSY